MSSNERWLGSVSRHDWSLDRRGEKDEERHNEKVKEAIKDKLDSLVSDGSIITADPHSKKKVKIPMKSLELPRFKYGDGEQGIGTGDGDSQPGDPAGQGDQPGEGEAGDKPGEEYYEAEFTIEEIQEMVFADLGLPNMKPRGKEDVESDAIVYNEVRKKRTPANLDMHRTVIQNLLRNAWGGDAKIGNISPDDYRVRTWEHERRPENAAVVIAMADISGSMGDFEKYVTRAYCWWTLNFLRTKYPKVDMVFIAHDTEAHEVNEEQFFSRGTGGGTKCSSANQLALDVIRERYPTDMYNVYPLHFSDGDNFGYDNDLSASLVNQILDEDVSQYAYLQINRSAPSSLLNRYRRDVNSDRFKGIIIKTKDDVFPALKEVFKAEGQ